MDSILYSIKQLLGIATEYRAFDEEIIMHVNSALMVLTQLGVGPKDGFEITGSNETWHDFLGDDTFVLSASQLGHHRDGTQTVAVVYLTILPRGNDVGKLT